MVFAPESNYRPYSDAPRCPIPLPTSSHFFPTLPAFFLPYPVVALVLYPRLFVSSISPEPFPYFCRPVSKLTARRCTKAPVVGVKAGASSTWQPKDWGPGHCLGPDGTQRSPRHPQHGDSDPPASSATVAFAVRTGLHGRRHAGSGSTNRVRLRDRSSGGPRGWIGKAGLGDDAELGPAERSG